MIKVRLYEYFVSRMRILVSSQVACYKEQKFECFHERLVSLVRNRQSGVQKDEQGELVAAREGMTLEATVFKEDIRSTI